MLQKILAHLVIAIAVTACSKSTPDVASVTSPSEAPRVGAQLDEAGLIAAVGSPAMYEYSLDDGRGLNFRSKCTLQECQPAFQLEFRSGRINVAWEQSSDNPKADVLSVQNTLWAEQVLTHAFGKEATAKIVANIQNNTPMRGELLMGHKVNLMPGGGKQVLLTINR